MRAAVMRRKKLVVADVPVPEAGHGEVLVKTLACGICGSDLHALKHAERLVESAKRSRGPVRRAPAPHHRQGTGVLGGGRRPRARLDEGAEGGPPRLLDAGADP